MHEKITRHLNSCNIEIKEMFHRIYSHLYASITSEIEERLWAGLPSFYCGSNFVRIIPFKDHLNIEATAISQHRQDLTSYKITSKGMLQIYLQQEIPYATLSLIFCLTLQPNEESGTLQFPSHK